MRHYHGSGIRKHYKFNKQVHHILGQVGFMLGESSERRVNEAFLEAAKGNYLPKWLIRWDQHERGSVQDKSGVDFTFFTDVGPIFVQVKSSVRNALRFLEHSIGKKVICVVVVDIRMSNAVIFDNVLRAVSKQREKFLAMRNASD